MCVCWCCSGISCSLLACSLNIYIYIYILFMLLRDFLLSPCMFTFIVSFSESSSLTSHLVTVQGSYANIGSAVFFLSFGLCSHWSGLPPPTGLGSLLPLVWDPSSHWSGLPPPTGLGSLLPLVWAPSSHWSGLPPPTGLGSFLPPVWAHSTHWSGLPPPTGLSSLLNLFLTSVDMFHAGSCMTLLDSSS